MKKVIRRIEPLSRVNARINLPGSKSITHRALLMASLAEGESEIRNALSAEDTLLTANALRLLGVEIAETQDRLLVTPPKKRWRRPDGPIMLGNSGTSARLLPATAATGEGEFIFDGGPRLRERPIAPVMEALEKLGARCRYLSKHGYLPVEITCGGLSGGNVKIDARSSSQFLSALLIAAPCAGSEVVIEWLEPVASFPYVSLTLAMMEEAGVEYSRRGANGVVIPAPQRYRPLNLTVEGDCSSASYFWAAAALTGGEVFTRPVSSRSRQGDCRLLEVLERMGCRIFWEEEGVRVKGPERPGAVDIDMNRMPDMVPTVAVLAAYADGRSRIRNVAHLRVKESDRLHAMTSELVKFGVEVQELPDGLVIVGGTARPPDAPIDAHDDHRIAMAFAVMGLRTAGVEIHGAESVAKSFPSFWDEFDRLYRERG